MDYIADEYSNPYNDRAAATTSWQNSVKKDLRQGIKSIKKGVRQGKRTICRGVRNASKFLDKPSSTTTRTTTSHNGGTAAAHPESDTNNIEQQQQEQQQEAQEQEEETHLSTPRCVAVEQQQCNIPEDDRPDDLLHSFERLGVEILEDVSTQPPPLVRVVEEKTCEVVEETQILSVSERETQIVLEEQSENQLPLAALSAPSHGVFQVAETEKICSQPFGIKMSAVRAPEDEKPGSVEYFQKWIQNLETSLVIPDMDQELWNETLQVYQKSKDALAEAHKALGEAKKRPEPDEAIIDVLTKAVEDATQELSNSFENTQTIAATILQTPEFRSFLQPGDFGDDDWVTWRVLKSVTPKQWAQWCQETTGSDGQSMMDLIVRMLQSTDFLREILQEGDGPRGNKYGNFLRLWQELGPQENPVLRRLAMAVALEFAAGDYNVFGTEDKVDPILRYIHYEQAYLGGELDPAFCTFGVWELRMVVNSDASDDQLSWGRSCLINYRPDLILWDNEQWRYNFIVKSDVAPKTPDWYKEPHTYDQILSGGGKCGPRAWYGRFICKAFGIPTWGCRQTGHAYMSRWTATGWVVCLGANWPYCFWESRTGTEFKLESDARRACSSSAEYLQLVQRLQWIVMRKGEKDKLVREKSDPSPLCPWSSLAMLQSKIIITTRGKRRNVLGDATNHTHDATLPVKDEKVILSKIQRMKNQGTPVPGFPCFDSDTNTLILPADCCTRPQQSTNKVHFHPSFSGGRQIFLQGDGVLQYQLGPPFVNDNGPKQYKLSLCVCTVHRAETVMRVTVSEQAGYGSREYTLALPYTMGGWDFTDPITIEFEGGSYPVLSFQRAFHGFGISIKEIKISPA